MSIQMNTQMKANAAQTYIPSNIQLKKAEPRMLSTLESIRADDGGNGVQKKGYCSCFSTLYSKIGSFFSSVFNCIKDFFCGKSPIVSGSKTVSETFQDLKKVMANGDKDAILAVIGKLPEAKRYELYREVYAALNPQGTVADNFGEVKVNENPKDPKISAAIQGFIVRQETILPLEDLKATVENINVAPDVVIQQFDALPTDIHGKNLQGELAYSVWKIKGENTADHNTADFGVNFIKSNPHDAEVVRAINDTLARL